MIHTRFPVTPIRELLGRRHARGESWEAIARRLGVCERSLFRLLSAKEIGQAAADEWALRLGLHPALLWPDRW